MINPSKPAFLNELGQIGAFLYEATTAEQRAELLSGLRDLGEGKPSKLERFAKLEAETIAIKAAGLPTK